MTTPTTGDLRPKSPDLSRATVNVLSACSLLESLPFVRTPAEADKIIEGVKCALRSALEDLSSGGAP